MPCVGTAGPAGLSRHRQGPEGFSRSLVFHVEHFDARSADVAADLGGREVVTRGWLRGSCRLGGHALRSWLQATPGRSPSLRRADGLVSPPPACREPSRASVQPHRRLLGSPQGRRHTAAPRIRARMSSDHDVAQVVGTGRGLSSAAQRLCLRLRLRLCLRLCLRLRLCRRWPSHSCHCRQALSYMAPGARSR